MRILLTFIVCASVVFAVACSPAQIKSAARVVSVATSQGKQLLADEVTTGDMTQADSDAVTPFLDEIGARASAVANNPRDFGKLTKAQQRQMVEQFISDVTTSADQLEAAGALHIKNGNAQKKFAKVVRDIRVGLAIAQAIEAALPQ